MKVVRLIQIAVAGLLTAASAAALDVPKPPAAAQSQQPNDPTQPRTLQWQDLIPEDERDRPFVGSSRARPLFDDETGPAALQEGPASVNKTLDGKQIKLPGFVVPLSIDRKQMVGEFLLVPYFGACIHVPPPPPNQIVYVALSTPIHLDRVYDPVWVTGRLTTQQALTGLAVASYSLAATKLEKYEEAP
jgi:hypothetical protein